MKSVNNRDVVQNSLSVLHIHVLLVAPLGTCHMAKPRADQHQGEIPVGERLYHAGCATADLAVQPFDHVVGADARPVFAGKVSVSMFLSMYAFVPFLSESRGVFAVSRKLEMICTPRSDRWQGVFL